MKKHFLIAAIFGTIFLLGCEEITPVTPPAEIPQEQVKEADMEGAESDNLADEDIRKAKSGEKTYYIHKNALWAGDKEISSLFNKLPGTTETDYYGEPFDHSEWFQREDEENHYVYLTAGKGCGGCIVNPAEYLAISKSTGELTVKTMNFTTKEIEKANLPAQGMRNLVSPDKTKVLFPSFLGEPDSAPQRQEVAYIYNLLTDEIEKTVEIPQGQTILNCMMACDVLDEAAKWNPNTNTFDITHIKAS